MSTVNDLRRLRHGWTQIEAEETRLLKQMTIQESVAQYLALQREFEPWLQESEAEFREPRHQAMIQLQARLQQLNKINRLPMDNLFQSLAAIQHKLEEAGIPSVAIGGLAVSFWGEPRLTRDVDVKVLLSREERGKLLALLADFTPLNADPDEALRRNGIAFFQDPKGIRLDVMLADTVFDETVIGRAQKVTAGTEGMVRVCTAEDLLVYKLVSLRPRDHTDCESIIKRQGDKLDDQYVENWLRQFEMALDDSTLVQEYRHLRGLT